MSIAAPPRWLSWASWLPLAVAACSGDGATESTSAATPAQSAPAKEDAKPDAKEPAAPTAPDAKADPTEPADADAADEGWGQQSKPPDLGAAADPPEPPEPDPPVVKDPFAEPERPMATKYGLPPRPAKKYGGPPRPSPTPDLDDPFE
jgi:hypothetical protein